MAEFMLQPRPALAGILKPGRHGRPDGSPGLRIQERVGLQIVSLAARHGAAGALGDIMRQEWGAELPATPRYVQAGSLSLLWSGPAQWLVVSDGAGEDLEVLLRRRLEGMASLAAQGDGRVVLRITGPQVRHALAKLLPIDLHPRAFQPGDTALTTMGGIGVQIWQMHDATGYELAAFRGFAGSVYESLLSAGAEYGVEIRD